MSPAYKVSAVSQSLEPSLLVSVHLPKTAGTSFLNILEQHYGKRLWRDYADRPLHSGRRSVRARAFTQGVKAGLFSGALKDVDCIHGHFLPLKYRFLARRRSLGFITWLRDPVERLASHYHYWLRSYDPAQAGRLHRRVVEEGWDLERFCMSEELRNIYSRFLWGFPLERFDFLGLTEHFASDLDYLAERFFAGDLPNLPMQNVNVESLSENSGDSDPVNSFVDGSRPEARPKTYVTDTAFREKICLFHAKDMAVYERALQLREQRGVAR